MTGYGNQLSNLYGRYSADGVHNKPMVITETSALYIPSNPIGNTDLQIKQAWWSQVRALFLPSRPARCVLHRVSTLHVVHCRVGHGFSKHLQLVCGFKHVLFGMQQNMYLCPSDMQLPMRRSQESEQFKSTGSQANTTVCRPSRSGIGRANAAC